MADGFKNEKQSFSTANNTPWGASVASLAAAQGALAGTISAAVLTYQTGRIAANLVYANSTQVANFNYQVSQTHANSTVNHKVQVANKDFSTTTTTTQNQQQSGVAEEPQSWVTSGLDWINNTANAIGDSLSTILINFAFFDDDLCYALFGSGFARFGEMK